MALRRSRSIVEYFAEHERYRCGYCGSSDTNYSHGMWAHSMTVQDYQDLIDRGWRRSGKYCYKPTMSVTCCPMYTIRCEAASFRLSKSHKKLLKRVNRFLITGQKIGKGESTDMAAGGDSFVQGRKSDVTLSTSDVKHDRTAVGDTSDKRADLGGGTKKKVKVDSTAQQESSKTKEGDGRSKSAAAPSQGKGPDTSKPQCQKARMKRLEKRMRKTGETLEEIKANNRMKNKEGKSLEDFLKEPEQAANPAHRLELKLVRSNPKSPEFLSTFVAAHQVYHRYQTTIHKDPPGKPNLKQYTRFLVDSPLEAGVPKEGEAGLPEGYGSFHQHYLLDGKLIAVGVVDILSHCVSSVYLYYDPDYSFLSLGTYSALRELALVRGLQKIDPAVAYYYMGFYIHSCPKMKYKGQYYPSYLACPEVYSWVPIERCVPKLDAAHYARLEEDPGKTDEDGKVDVDRVLVMHDGEAMSYEVYKVMTKRARDQDEVKEYASFTGMTCAQRMLLFRK